MKDQIDDFQKHTEIQNGKDILKLEKLFIYEEALLLQIVAHHLEICCFFGVFCFVF